MHCTCTSDRSRLCLRMLISSVELQSCRISKLVTISCGYLLKGDSLEYHNNAPFSTWDHDYTQSKCASKRHGAWWFKWCLNSNLNGEYGKGFGYLKMIWHHWLGMEGLKATEMKIRHASFEGGLYHRKHC